MLYVRELAQLATQTCTEQLLAMFRQLVINTPTSYFADEEQYTGHSKSSRHDCSRQVEPTGCRKISSLVAKAAPQPRRKQKGKTMRNVMNRW